jgi:hypothetical protein
MSLSYWAKTPEGTSVTITKTGGGIRRTVYEGITAKCTKSTITIDLLRSDESIRFSWPKASDILVDNEVSLRWKDPKTEEILRIVRNDILYPNTKKTITYDNGKEISPMSFHGRSI